MCNWNRRLLPLKNVLFYRDSTKLSNEILTNSLRVKLATLFISKTKRNRKTVRGNQSPFINKEIFKSL